TLHSIAILGAGELAATLARRIAEEELARRVILVDADEPRARGKALDIAQSGPVEGFDVQVEAAVNLAAAGAFDALAIADPPELVVSPRESACVAGVPVDRLSPVALRRAMAGLAGRMPGPVALAAAAARVLRALGGSRPSMLGVLVSLQGEYGHRGVAVAVPARLAAGRVESVVEVP